MVANSFSDFSSSVACKINLKARHHLFTIDMEVSAFLSDGGTSKSSSRHEVMIQVTPGHGGSFSHSPQVLSNLP
jgi:hypothetical protein